MANNLLQISILNYSIQTPKHADVFFHFKDHILAYLSFGFQFLWKQLR